MWRKTQESLRWLGSVLMRTSDGESALMAQAMRLAVSASACDAIPDSLPAPVSLKTLRLVLQHRPS
ncbi:hypothetical protein H4W80_002443 [Nonomuraea angiospora]|uniref:Uncharacterized protein n=1 Tax=Nonomuraea angiospora TaxID=46172 RepID=A0ABR9LV42_9ACTN|nr:hypothetical protein [Nonomuraea angiospora]